MPHLIFLVFVPIVIVALVFGIISARKRREAMFALATKLGLRFDQAKSRSLARRYKFLDKLRRGSNRYAYNTLSGNYQ